MAAEMTTPERSICANTMESVSKTTTSSSKDVEILERSEIPAIQFAVPLTLESLQGLEDQPSAANLSSLTGDNGVVGSMVLLQNSAMVWVGWGAINPYGREAASTEDSRRFGTGSPEMGQLVVAMPRTNYKGAFGTGSKEASSSHLIGSESGDDQILASQMASRLSTRSGIPIFVSCQLSPGSFDPAGWTSGIDSELVSHRAAALAEKEVFRILKEHDKVKQS